MKRLWWWWKAVGILIAWFLAASAAIWFLVLATLNDAPAYFLYPPLVVVFAAQFIFAYCARNGKLPWDK